MYWPSDLPNTSKQCKKLMTVSPHGLFCLTISPQLIEIQFSVDTFSIL